MSRRCGSFPKELSVRSARRTRTASSARRRACGGCARSSRSRRRPTRTSLLLGESGTGKELAARAVHQLSQRGRQQFVARNAATLPAGLIDAELFGNAKNYPNPGMPERRGLIGEADGGSLFLDEIGELPVELQAHLLRVLDGDGEYQRLGEGVARRSNFRLIAATNRDPSTLKHDLAARFTARIELPTSRSGARTSRSSRGICSCAPRVRSGDIAKPFIATDAERLRVRRASTGT